MRIQFDETNLLAEVERSRGKTLKAVAAFRKRSEQGLYGFPHLPFQTAVIGERGYDEYRKQFAGYEEKRRKP